MAFKCDKTKKGKLQKRLFRLIISFNLIFFFTAQVSLCDQTHSNSESEILLPICQKSCSPVYGRISETGGCYSWTTDRRDLLTIEEIKTHSDLAGCHSEVLITPNTKNLKDSPSVTARESNSKKTFTTRVGFAYPKSISIEKQFDRMTVGETITLQILAHDERGNLFSSLEGWKFNWKIIEGSEYAEIHKLKTGRRKHYGKGRQFAEETAFSDLVLLRGKNAGKIKVQVEIMEEEFMKTIPFDVKTLYIIEPFRIMPQGPLYFLPGTKYNFNIFLTNSKRFIREDEKQFYHWKVMDETCSTVDQRGNYKALNKECYTQVVAKDKRVEFYNEDSVLVNVVYPNSLELVYLPISPNQKDEFYKNKLSRFDYLSFSHSSFWKLVEGKDYLIQNFLIYNGNFVIFDQSQVKFKNQFESISKHIEKGKISCSSMTNEICQMSTTSFSTEEKTIESSVALGGSRVPLHASNKVMIYSRVKIEKFGMPFFTLPLFDGVKVPYQELYLKISGGSGDYKILSENPSVIQVENNNYVYAYQQLGESLVTVLDKQIEENNDTVLIKTKEIQSLTYFEERQEIPVGDDFDITPIGLHTMNHFDVLNIFTNCSRLNVDKSILSQTNVKENEIESPLIYQRIREFISRNRETSIKNKIKFNKINSEKYADYLDYSSFGICSINNFKGVSEGFVHFKYKNYQNGKVASSLNEAKVYLFNALEHIPIFSDYFTNKLIEKGKISNPDLDKTFIIPKGHSLTIKFKGGVVPWPEAKKDYSESVYTFDKYNNLADISSIKKYIGMNAFDEKMVMGSCFKEGYDNTIQFEIGNKPDATLLNPARNKYTFKFGCYSPKHLSMFLLSQQDNIDVPMYASPQQKGLKYYEAKNYTDIIRVYSFDESNRIICNISSLKGEWKIYDEKDTWKNIKKYYEIIKPNDYNKYNLSDINYSNEFIQDVFLFKEYVTSFNIMHILHKNILKHYLTIYIVDIPILIPSQANIYIKNKGPFEIKIHGGSGSFKVSSPNQHFASISYQPGSRSIYLTPYSVGFVVVELIDTFRSNQVVKGKYNLVDLKEIRIQDKDMIMQNTTNTIPVRAIDSLGNEMTVEQMKGMPFDVVTNKGNDAMFLSMSENHTLAYVTGIISGQYIIQVVDKESGLKSNECQIEVFDKVEIFPPYLLMIPSSSFTLYIRGGPSKTELIQMKYEMDNMKIAEVASPDYPLVKAKEIGQTILRVTFAYKFNDPKFAIKEEDKALINKTNKILYVQEVPVTVAFPEKIEIIPQENNREIKREATIRLLSSLKKGNQIFTYGTGPIKFYWKAENQKVGKLVYYMKSKDEVNSGCSYDENGNERCSAFVPIEENMDPSSSIGVFFNSLDIGRCTISLNIEINYPDYPYQYRKDKYDTKTEIVVTDEAFMGLQRYCKKKSTNLGSSYLVPLDVDHQLSITLKTDAIYKITQQEDIDSQETNSKIVELTESGKLTTFMKQGTVIVKVTHKFHSNKKEVPTIIPLFITEFHSIFIENTNQLMEVEVGQEIILKIIIQHISGMNFARKFDRMKLRVIESHPKIATSELIESNSEIRIRTHNLGNTNIILFHPNTLTIYDVFRLTVNKSGNTQTKILMNIGGTINFLEKDLELKNKMCQNSHWESDNQDIVEVDKYGKATALKEGIATISLRPNNDILKTHYAAKIEVTKISSVRMDTSYIPKGLTDIKQSSDYKENWKIPVEFLSVKEEKFATNSNDTQNIIDQNVDVKCISQNQEFIVARSQKEGGENFCELIVRNVPFKKGVKKPKDIEIKLEMDSLSPKNKKKKYSKTNSQKLPFTSSFLIKYNMDHLDFDSNKREVTLNLDNLSDLKITVSDPEKITTEMDYVNNNIKVKISSNIAEDFQGEKLTLMNIISGQKKEITINYKSFLHGYKYLGFFDLSLGVEKLTFIFMIFVIIFALFVCSGNKNILGYLIGNNNNNGAMPPQNQGPAPGPAQFQGFNPGNHIPNYPNPNNQNYQNNSNDFMNFRRGQQYHYN